MKKILMALSFLLIAGCSFDKGDIESNFNDSSKDSQSSVNLEEESEPDNAEGMENEDAQETNAEDVVEGENNTNSDTTNPNTTNSDTSTENNDKPENSNLTASEKEQEYANLEKDNPAIHGSAWLNSLYTEYGDPTKFETKFYLSTGDEVELIKEEKIYAKVKLNGHKVVNSTDGVRRKALVLNYTQTNMSDSDIEVGPFGIATEPTFVPEVYYSDKKFKIMSHTEPSTKMYDENYINNQHVQYTEEDAGIDSCMRVAILKPGESRDCYAHYSVIGPGEYLVGQIAEIGFNEWRTYKVNVTMEEYKD